MSRPWIIEVCIGAGQVCANHVMLLDVWWNPTVEDQAIDRAHRLGQTKPVYVKRFTVKETVEDRILALQESKKQMVSRDAQPKGCSIFLIILCTFSHYYRTILFGITYHEKMIFVLIRISFYPTFAH